MKGKETALVSRYLINQLPCLPVDQLEKIQYEIAALIRNDEQGVTGKNGISGSWMIKKRMGMTPVKQNFTG
ncbi:MAG: hypothetical protein U9N03_04375 [Candidatus Caldatribacteriota bacterium]|nr:hypothetical protein [Candidatus Caldatribacteriota bacterium]